MLPAPGGDRLSVIGELLGCGVAAVASDSRASGGSDALLDTSELIDLWLTIPDAAGREALLVLARKLASA